MRTTRLVSAGSLVGLLVLGCGEPTAPPAGSGASEARPSALSIRIGDLMAGVGTFVHPTLGSVTFVYTALRLRDGKVAGKFFQNQRDLGFTYAGDVTCFAVDPVKGRAWIGGVLTNSNDTDPIAQAGHDAWFRVLDTGLHSADPDRSTFLGFEGGGGIATSAEYCAARIWPDDNARAWPVTRGNILIH